jgi:hypothetical protein
MCVVDRILKQQKAERQAAEQAARTTAENTALISKPSLDTHSRPPPPIPKSSTRPISPPSALPPHVPPKLPGSFDSADDKSSTHSLVKSGLRPASTMIQNWRRKFTEMADPSTLVPNGVVAPPSGMSGSSGTQSRGPRSNNSAVTPQSNICEYHRILSPKVSADPSGT